MIDRDKIAREFGTILAGEPGPDTLDERLARQKAAVIRIVIARSSHYYRRRSVLVTAFSAVTAVAAAFAVCFIVYSVTRVPDDNILFFVGNSLEAAPEGHFIKTEVHQSETVRFSGGHRFQFAEQTKARIVKSGDGQVIVDVEQGEVLAQVVPGNLVAWTVRAGPYEVSVKGTVFSVHWNDAAAVLSVSVERGKVAVHGPGMDGEGVFVSAGNSLKAESNRRRITFEQCRSEGSLAAAAVEAADTAEDSAVDNRLEEAPADEPVEWSESEAPSSIFAKGNAFSADWQGMYAAKDFQGILVLAEKKGIPGIKRRLGRDDLWIVANSARYARNNRLADELFEAFRSRFPAASQSQTAAFLLAKSSLKRGNLLIAKRWFEVYLAETPDGPLAEEALGLLIHVYSKMGDTLQADRVARSYLDKYKGGYFTKQARMVIEN